VKSGLLGLGGLGVLLAAVGLAATLTDTSWILQAIDFVLLLLTLPVLMAAASLLIAFFTRLVTLRTVEGSAACAVTASLCAMVAVALVNAIFPWGGWPIMHSVKGDDYNFGTEGFYLLLDLSLAAVILVATERVVLTRLGRLRRGQRPTLRQTAAFLLAAAAVAALIAFDRRLLSLGRPRDESAYFCSALADYHWYEQLPLWFGLFCAALVFVDSLLDAAGRTVSAVASGSSRSLRLATVEILTLIGIPVGIVFALLPPIQVTFRVMPGTIEVLAAPVLARAALFAVGLVVTAYGVRGILRGEFQLSHDVQLQGAAARSAHALYVVLGMAIVWFACWGWQLYIRL
jgi:hypothetical protein